MISYMKDEPQTQLSTKTIKILVWPAYFFVARIR